MRADTHNMYKSVLLDIEGTICPIAFVTDVMFPFALDNVEDFLSKQWNNDKCIDIVNELAKELPLDTSADVKSIAKLVKVQMGRNQKTTPLKAFQGLIWSDAFHSGLLKSDIFPDVPVALKKWTDGDIQVNIYSSGSIHAQKLVLQFSNHGNLLPFINKHFDTTTGSKLSPSSYQTIATELGFKPSDVLFISDNAKELLAADCAGMLVSCADRPGNVPEDIVLRDHQLQLTVQQRDAEEILGVSTRKTFPACRDFLQL